MKHKFSSMGRVALAVVLALSLSLVMAVPVLADVSEPAVTPSPATVGTTAQYTIVFTTTATLGVGGEIYIEFPSDTVVPASYATDDVTIGGVGVASGDISGSGNIVTITLAAGISGGTAVTVVFTTAADIVNPTTVGTTYTLDVWTSAAGDSTHVQSAAYTITAAPDVTNPTVSLTAPNGGEKWATGSVQSITWTASDDIDTKLTIDLDYYDGSNWNDIIILANTSLTAYSWTVASENSTTCKVRVTATDDATNSALDVSDAVFTIDAAVPTVVVTAPNGSQTWVESSTHSITWTCSATDLATNPIAIDYSTDSGTTWTSVATGEANDLTYSWTLPAVYSTTCKVKVTATDAAGNTHSDMSDAVFIIDDTTDPLAVTVVSPDGGESWTKGSTQSITWTGGTDAVDTATSITLEYSNDAGVNWTQIATSETNDGTYSWTPLPAVGVNYLVKVTATDDAGNTAFDVSDAVFTIINPVHNATQDIRYADIQTALDAAVADDTIDVSPGTYVPGSALTIATAGLTLQSTGTAAETIITAPASPDGAIRIIGDDVIVDGFTIIDSSGTQTAYGILCVGADDAIIRNNVVTFVTAAKGGIDTGIGTGMTVSGNTLNEFATMTLHGSDCTMSGNVFGRDILVWPTSSTLSGTTITDNTFPARPTEDVNGAINIWGDASVMATVSDTLIEGNDLSNRDEAGLRIGTTNGANLTVTTLTVTGNDITDNYVAGISIHADVTWGAGNTISNNNIVGNKTLGIDNNIVTTVIDASNNWWGDASGPFHTVTNLAGTGDAVSENVDYRPWLAAPYVMPADPATSAIISLVSGWNLISLPIMPTSSVIATVLADLITDETVDQVRTYQQGWYNWASTEPHGTLTIMEDGSGYWIDMIAADTLVIAGSELPAPPATPPSYSVYTGWNMIGFKSVATNTSVAAYLGSLVSGTLEAIYGYDAAAAAYFVPGVTSGHDFLEPGCGYWLAVNAGGTIYP